MSSSGTGPAPFTVVYGWRESDIEVVAGALCAALAIEWQARHSFYVGDYYLWPPTPAEPEEQQGPARLVLQLNFFDEVDQELAYPEWPEHHVLLHATGLDPDWVERLEATGAEVLDDE